MRRSFAWASARRRIRGQRPEALRRQRVGAHRREPPALPLGREGVGRRARARRRGRRDPAGPTSRRRPDGCRPRDRDRGRMRIPASSAASCAAASCVSARHCSQAWKASASAFSAAKRRAASSGGIAIFLGPVGPIGPEPLRQRLVQGEALRAPDPARCARRRSPAPSRRRNSARAARPSAPAGAGIVVEQFRRRQRALPSRRDMHRREPPAVRRGVGRERRGIGRETRMDRVDARRTRPPPRRGSAAASARSA